MISFSTSVLVMSLFQMVIKGVYNSWKSPGILLMLSPGKFNCQLKYDNMSITEPNLVTSLNVRNCFLTIFCAVLFIMSHITESACVRISCCKTSEAGSV